jgi:X-X-X-Leu-X-X-Gly heptad repeat protein
VATLVGGVATLVGGVAKLVGDGWLSWREMGG